MTTIISGGALVPAAKSFPLGTSMATTRGNSAGYIPLLRGEGLALTYEGMYRTQPWVYAVVNKLSYGIARLPLKTFTMNEDGSRDRSRGNSLDRLLSKPRPGQSPFDRKLNICGSLFIHGHALELKFRSEGAGATPDELWLTPWRNVQVIEDESGIIGYNVMIGGKSVPVAPSEVIHYQLLNGVSPMEPLRRTLALEDAAIEFQGQNFANGITPRGAFVSEQRIPKDDAERVRQELSQMYAGVENAGRFGVLGNGFKWAQMGESAVDAELINQRRLSREEVCGAYDVAPPLVGILDRATFNNIDVLHKGLYVDSIGPKVTLLEETQQAQLIDTEPAWDGFFSEFDMNDVLRPDAEARMRSYLMSQQSSTTTTNERRRMENLPRIDDPMADTVFMPANMFPLGQIPDPAVVGTASMADQLTMQAFLGKQTTPEEVTADE